jgi:hypothetical protein
MDPRDEAEELPEQVSDARRLLAVALFAWPIFGVLDILGADLWNDGRGFRILIAIRVGGTALLAINYISVRFARLSLRSLAVLDCATCTTIGVMVAAIGIVFHGGLPSRDFAGMIILVTVRAWMWPSHWKRCLIVAATSAAAWPATLALGSAYVHELRAQWASPVAVAEFGYGMVFIVFSAGLSIAGSHALWTFRRQVRAKSRELTENRAELASKVGQLEVNNVELRRLNEELAVSNHRADRIFTALAEALPGKVLDGKYQLRDRIGAGGFGVVFSATHLVMRRPVAVKVFRPTPGNDSAQALERFRREAISACLVRHPNAVAVYDSGISAEQIPYLAMELLEGESLATLLAREKKLELGRCLSLAVPVCDALQVAHDQGIVHRDVKPENVFLHKGGSEEIVKVVDFGIAALLHTTEASTVANKLTATNVVVGTPAYVAPERVIGDDYDGRADVYSVGVMIYEMLTGHLPIEYRAGALGLAAFIRQATQVARPLSEWLPEVPDEIESLVMRVLSREPSLRPTAGDLAAELRRLRQSSLHTRVTARA